MAKVEICLSLVAEIKRRFSKAEAHEIFDLIETLAEHPLKGKPLGAVGGIAIKELKYKKYRFYFLADGFALKMIDEEAITELLLRFVRMSDKKQQRAVIEEIKTVLKKIGPMGFA